MFKTVIKRPCYQFEPISFLKYDVVQYVPFFSFAMKNLLRFVLGCAVGRTVGQKRFFSVRLSCGVTTVCVHLQKFFYFLKNFFGLDYGTCRSKRRRSKDKRQETKVKRQVTCNQPFLAMHYRIIYVLNYFAGLFYYNLFDTGSDIEQKSKFFLCYTIKYISYVKMSLTQFDLCASTCTILCSLPSVGESLL